MFNFQNFTLNSFEDCYGKASETSRMEEEKLESNNLNASSLKKVNKSKKSASRYDQKNVFRNSMTGVIQVTPLKPTKVIEQNIDFAKPKSFGLLQSTHTICFSKKNASVDMKLNTGAQNPNDINNDLLRGGALTDLRANSNDEAETRQLRKFRWSNNKDKCFCEKLTVIYWALLLDTTKRANKRRPILCHQVIAEFFNRVYKEKLRVPITSRYIRDNLVTWTTQGKELHEKGWIDIAKTGDFQEQFSFATIKLYESAECGRFIASKDKVSKDGNTEKYCSFQPEEESIDTTDETGPVTTWKSTKEDRRELIRNQILVLDLHDEDFFENVMRILSSIDEPELRQYVTIILELVNMEIDDGKTVREKLRDVEMTINKLQVDIREMKEILTVLANK